MKEIDKKTIILIKKLDLIFKGRMCLPEIYFTVLWHNSERKIMFGIQNNTMTHGHVLFELKVINYIYYMNIFSYIVWIL